MPRAEAGSTKALSNQLKSKGLQRLRWYCQACSRQMRDENGFKCHVASESHVRNMMVIGEDPRKAINEFSRQFQRDFVQLLRTGHGEKKINANHFYQEYIGNKEHVHMNATRWASLTEFVKMLGREGVVRVEEDEGRMDEGNERGGASGLMIAWIDDSPEALRRKEAVRRREAQDRGDEELEQRLVREQIRRARRDGVGKREEEGDDELGENGDEEERDGEGIKRRDGEKIVLDFGSKKHEKPPTPPLTDKEDSPEDRSPTTQDNEDVVKSHAPPTDTKSTPAVKPISFGAPAKSKNIFASAPKKNALTGPKKYTAVPERPMSAAERIMKEELERKRQRDANGGGHGFKKQRVG